MLKFIGFWQNLFFCLKNCISSTCLQSLVANFLAALILQANIIFGLNRSNWLIWTWVRITDSDCMLEYKFELTCTSITNTPPLDYYSSLPPVHTNINTISLFQIIKQWRTHICSLTLIGINWINVVLVHWLSFCVAQKSSHQ